MNPNPAPAAKPTIDREPPSSRLLSLDAYRGAIMISLAFAGFGLAETARRHLATETASSFWSILAYQFEHVEWVGCAYWDMIQPSFMFMVGVSMAYSYVKREQLGQSYWRMFLHAVVRALVLILLGVFLSSTSSKVTNWAFMNVLSQIGLGYAFLFLLWRRGLIVQLIAATLLLAGTWGCYVTYTAAGVDIENGKPAVGVTAEWAQKHLTGIGPAWHKNSNIGQAVDLKVLNWFPRPEPFTFNGGGYQTINFVPSLATMIFGLICGEWLRSPLSNSRKLRMILVLGVVCLVIGWGLSAADLIPIVKRIWTPSWALFSTGLCCLILAGLFGVIDVLQWRGWAFPLVVMGTNSIAVYLMSQMLKPWVSRSLQTHFGQDVFLMLGESWEPFVRSNLIGLVFWLICLWLYKQRVFLKI
jgi:heparan-alpha-glucosaminide N-acetyltransferase